MSRCARCCEAEDNDDKPRLPIAGLSLWEPPGFGDPNMDERDTLDNCRCKLGPANTFESRLLDEVVELISSSSSEASSSGCSAMRDSRLDVGAAPSSKSCAGSDGSIRLRPSIICTQTQSERRPHARAAREAMAFSGPFEGHQRVIRGPSAGHSRAILNGQTDSKAIQRVVRGAMYAPAQPCAPDEVRNQTHSVAISAPAQPCAPSHPVPTPTVSSPLRTRPRGASPRPPPDEGRNHMHSDAIRVSPRRNQASVTSFRSRSREICMYGSSEAVSTWMTSSTVAEMLMR